MVGFAAAASVLAFASVWLPSVARASSFPDTPAGFCAAQTTGAPDDASALAFCTDLVQDLSDIGDLLGLPIIRPTGSSLTTPVRVIFSKEAGSTAVTALMARPFGSEPCEINVYPVGYDDQISADTGVSLQLHVQIAHEVVHCYQNLVGAGFPEWVSEGSATYLATLYAHHYESNTDGAWKRWIGGSDTADETRNLTLRSYDAIGWLSLVAHVTGDPLWSKMAGAWKAYLSGGATAYIAALGGDSTAVAKAWAPSVLNTPTWGDAWTTPATPGVDVPAAAKPTEFTGLSAGTDSDRERIEPLSAIVDDESVVNNALIEVSVSDGYASVHDAAGYADIGFQDEFFCLGTACKPDAVSCPGAKKPLKPIELTPPFVVAAGGGTTAATYEIAKIPQPGPCKPSLPGGAPLAPHAGFSEGDPHLETLNGGGYDFQAAGEYTLVRSDNGEVQVQVREAPLLNSHSVSSNTAVAMRVDGSKVEIDTGQPPVVLLNGKRVTLPRNGSARHLPGGGTLFQDSQIEVTAKWADGSEADIWADREGENVTFAPPSAGVDHLVGLFNALAPAKKSRGESHLETLVGSDGHRYVLDPDTKAGFKTLNGAFANSWRVTDKTSLFTYPAGKTTASYSVKDFPVKEATIAGLSPSNRAHAHTVCQAARITDTRLLNDCVLDVGTSGDAAFATATAQVQKATAAPSTSAPRRPQAPITQAGSTHAAKYYFAHPCAALTEAEIADALGQSFPTSLGGLGVCDIGTDPAGLNFPDNIFFSNLSVTESKVVGNAKVGSNPVAGLGDGAYCITTRLAGATVSRVIASLGSAGSLQAATGSCEQSSALAKAALSHISGN